MTQRQKAVSILTVVIVALGLGAYFVIFRPMFAKHGALTGSFSRVSNQKITNEPPTAEEVRTAIKYGKEVNITLSREGDPDPKVKNGKWEQNFSYKGKNAFDLQPARDAAAERIGPQYETALKYFTSRFTNHWNVLVVIDVTPGSRDFLRTLTFDAIKGTGTFDDLKAGDTATFHFVLIAKSDSWLDRTKGGQEEEMAIEITNWSEDRAKFNAKVEWLAKGQTEAPQSLIGETLKRAFATYGKLPNLRLAIASDGLINNGAINAYTSNPYSGEAKAETEKALIALEIPKIKVDAAFWMFAPAERPDLNQKVVDAEKFWKEFLPKNTLTSDDPKFTLGTDH